MALARKCDRCGKLHEYYPTGNRMQYNAVKCVFKTNNGLTNAEDRSKDLCPECMAEFDAFMTAKRER